MPDLANLDTHLSVIRACARTWQGRRLLLASPPGTRYPYVYPRDLGGSSRVLAKLALDGVRSKEAIDYLESSVEFLLAVQRHDGFWGQRYDLEGNDTSIYKQEDNPAHGTLVLLDYLEAAAKLDLDVPRRGSVVDAAVRAHDFALKANFRPGINLFYSTTSVHESGIEEGYTLWTNCAYLAAGRRLIDVLEAENRHGEFRHRLEAHTRMHAKNMRRHFVQDGVFIRRITPRGRYDRRPDVTLLSPYYFGVDDVDPEALRRSAVRVEKDLTDPDLGLLQRYLPFAEDLTIHIHAGNGPWMAYSAIYAQYQAQQGNKEKAREVLSQIAGYATADGCIPEHLSTRERYLDYMVREWETGLDFEKEFEPSILLPGVNFSRIVEELVHMRDELRRCAVAANATTDPVGVLRFATPLMWSHAEFMYAVMMLDPEDLGKEGLAVAEPATS